MEQLLLIRYSEIHLKGGNRPYFIKALIDNIKVALKSNDIYAKVHASDSRLYCESDDIAGASSIISKVFGVHSLSVAQRLTQPDYAALSQAANDLMRQKRGSFKVEARRSDKSYPLNSQELAIELGGDILSSNENLTVDVHNPEQRLYVEVRLDGTYMYDSIIPGPGGMPIGTSGKAMVLLSGGIDSPVSAYMMCKRGLGLGAVHFYSPPFTSERALDKVKTLLKKLSPYTGRVNLYVVPFTKIQTEIYEKCPNEELTVIMRRFMMKIAERLAHKHNCGALVTGESIGQVASQTLHAINCTNAVVDMPVLRPLIGLDKIEIIEVAKKIDTFETSILPYEDCCTVFTPDHPTTKPRPERIEASERKLDVEALIDEAIEGTQVFRPDADEE